MYESRMIRPPYSRFRGQRLTLNDYLAIDRTVLANERTFLAYGRTALALAVVGGTCLKFFDTIWIRAIGAGFILAGILVAARGWVRYIRTKRLLATALTHQTGAAEHPLKEKVSESQEKEAKTEE
jgi:putative membrane protein